MLEDEISLLQKIETLAERENDYRCAAYLFVYAALEYTVNTLERDQASDQERHVTGQELSRGIASYAREQFGPMARSVFDHWGINSTLDFGKIVFRLVDNGVMRRTENDRLEDFRDVYDFDLTFDPKKIQKSIAGLDLERLLNPLQILMQRNKPEQILGRVPMRPLFRKIAYENRLF